MLIAASRKYGCLALLSFFWLPVPAQFYGLPTDYAFSLRTSRVLSRIDSSVHSSMQPFVSFFSLKYNFVPDSQRIFRFIKDDPALDKVFFDHLIAVRDREGTYTLRLDPLLNFEYGRDLATAGDDRLFNNTRGFIGSGSVGKNFYFETMVAENQSVLPAWLHNYANGTGVIPGQGRWKTFRQNGFDYAFANGFVSVSMSQHINIQAGHGKHKIGYGYRSLLLSDNAFNYPYVKISQQWLRGRLQYHNIYAVLSNLVPAAAVIPQNAERLFQKKPAAFQYFSFNPSGRLNAGLFQGIIWQAGDAKNRQHLTWNYFNPVIFGQTAYFGFENRNNVLAGGDIRLKLTGKTSCYAQAMIDGTQRGKSATGYQAGIIMHDLFKISNLFFQAEYNHAGRDSYQTTSNMSDQSWTHYGESLAYTPGSGDELALIGDYRKGRLFFSVRYHYQDRPVQAESRTYIDIVSGRAGYVINPSYNLNISAGILYRNQKFSNFSSVLTSRDESSYVFVSLKTSLYNIYYDF